MKPRIPGSTHKSFQLSGRGIASSTGEDCILQFLLFLTAIIRAVDDYQDLLRISVASAGNDHRLGANEAPPAVISIFLGDELTAILDALEKGVAYGSKGKEKMRIGVTVLPDFVINQFQITSNDIVYMRQILYIDFYLILK